MACGPIPYVCPACRLPLEHVAAADGLAVLVCPQCSMGVPCVEGFPLFGDALPHGGVEQPGPLDEALAGFAKDDGYARFVQQRWQRPVHDAYACFQPFNESTRAFDALAALIEAELAPGDLILDLWGRTGWSGELLAARFPRQRVISLWEGRQGVLGLAGYRHWLARGRRRENLEIAFAHPGAPLPIATGSIKLVHGLDTLHRYSLVPLLGECLRVCRPDGIMAFPHVHLTNSEPEPFFERGGAKYHGTLWRALLERVVRGSSRRAFVMSEGDLFLKPGERHVLRDHAETPHYNGFVLLADASWDGRSLVGPEPAAPDPNAFLIDNPLLDLDLATGRVRIDRGSLAGGADHLLLRHPIYEARLRDAAAVRLDELQVQLLYWARRCLSLGETAARIGRPLARLQPALDALARSEIALALPVSRGMAELQRFYVTQEDPRPPRTFRELFEGLRERFGSRPVFVVEDDGSEFGVDDIHTLVGALGGWFGARELQVGDRILCVSDQHPEYLLTLWTAWLCGLQVVPVDPEATPATVAAIVQRTGPRVCFCDAASRHLLEGVEAPVVQFDELTTEPSGDAVRFGELIEPLLEREPPRWPELAPGQPALILFTSGSRGEPKGVCLDQGSILSTGRLLGRAYGWTDTDVVLSMGGHHVMSGVRNPAVAAPMAGARLVLASRMHRGQPVAVAELARKHALTVITTVPAFIAALRAQHGRLRGQPFRTTRLFMVTGAPLDAGSARDVENQFSTNVRSYYGLTETGGVCCFVPIDCTDPGPGGIGQPLGAVLQVVDRNGAPVAPGVIGELRVLSDHLMHGYLDGTGTVAGAPVALRGGWLYTGDAAVQRPDGLFQVVGRLDERIKDARGECIYPDEIEAALNRLPGVREATALGYADAAGQERIAAFVVLDSADADFTSWLSDAQPALLKILERRKLPTRVVRIDGLPRGVNGKVQKRALQERLVSD